MFFPFYNIFPVVMLDTKYLLWLQEHGVQIYSEVN